MNHERTKAVLVILGMHRSGTSATSGVFARLGVTPPKDLMPAAPRNAKGFYESVAITAFNDALLDALGMTWFDLGKMPQHWPDQLDADWYDQGGAILGSEFGDADVALMKDPRVCRLLPFWLRVFERKARVPIFAVIHRPPVEVAGSLETWANYPPEFGELLWLRYVLEAEATSRGARRAFLSYAELLSDWRGTAARLASELGITLDPGDAARAEVDDFLSGALKHFEITEDAPAAILPEASETFALLEHWCKRGEDVADHADFDARLQRLDAANGSLLPMTNSAIERFRQATALDQFRQGEHLRTSLAQEVCQTEHLRTSLAQSEVKLEELSDGLSTAKIEIRSQRQVFEDLRAEHDELCQQLATARRKPMKLLGDLWKYKLLKRLGADASPLPPRMKARMMNSAIKRHPARSLPGWRN